MKSIGIFFVIFLSLFFLIIFINSKSYTEKISSQPQKIDLIRKSAVAGSFYPTETKSLQNDLNAYLNQSQPISTSGKLRILIVPHAGIRYSGAVAAEGFKQLIGKNYSRIIMVGVSHHDIFSHAAIFNQGYWQTPLGKTAVDTQFANSILDQDQQIIADITSHEQEHSLEVELIFLQTVLKNFTIVPILLSQPNDDLINNLAKKISDNFDDTTLLLISSDLVHYPDWQTAKQVDEQTINSILTVDEQIFKNTIANLEAKKYPGVETLACGYEAIRIGLKVGENLKITEFKKIAAENSGDVTDDKSRVVGYAAIGGFGGQFTQGIKEEALKIARDTLNSYLLGKPIPSYVPKNQDLLKFLGAFVTLRNKDQLRGCMGLFDPNIPLYQVIQKATVAAASNDIRFSSVTKDEFKNITIEVSVMSPRKKIDDWHKIILGIDGVYMKNGERAGTFLPQVASDNGWDKEQFLNELCTQKANLPLNCYLDPQTELFIFNTQIYSE